MITRRKYHSSNNRADINCIEPKKIHSLISNSKRSWWLLPMFYIAVFFPSIAQAQVTFSSSPENMQLLGRDTATNKGYFTVRGTVNKSTTNYDSLRMTVHRGSALYSQEVLPLLYTGNIASFQFTGSIDAEEVNYKITVESYSSGGYTTERIITDVVAGDVYIVQGQSNAAAKQYDGSANGYQSNFIRTYAGNQFDSSALLSGGLGWHIAEGNTWYVNGSIGQWGLKLARSLMDTLHIPIAIFNGAHGGKTISFFQRPTDYQTSLNSNYGRLYYRLNETKLRPFVRGVFWAQGETDGYVGTPIFNYKSDFNNLKNAWLQDFQNLERFYILQTKNGCGGTHLYAIKEAQRQLAEEDTRLDIMQTAALTSHTDNCHFPFTNGYEAMADRLFPVVLEDIYQDTSSIEVRSPKILRAYIKSPDSLIIVTDATQLSLANSAADFQLTSSTGATLGGAVTLGGTLRFGLSKWPGKATISYLGSAASAGSSGNYVVNDGGIEIICFFEYPIKAYGANSASFGNLYVHEGGVFGVFGKHYFLEDTIHTERSGGRGYFQFVAGSSWHSTSTIAYLDGYAKYSDTGRFVFPIGDEGTYNPAAISSNLSETSAAYFKTSPSNAILPAGASFTRSTRAANINHVSNTESWDINGADTTRITLTWDMASGITQMTGSDLSKLTITGWDGAKWVRIASTVDSAQIRRDTSAQLYDSLVSTLNRGSITTDLAIVPNAYQVYTLASDEELIDFGDFSGFNTVEVFYQDDDLDGIPDGSNSVWLGNSVTADTSSNANSTASGDTGDDGLSIPTVLDSTTLNNFAITLSAAGAATAHYKLEIDWNGDNSVDSTYTGNHIFASAGSYVVSLPIHIMPNLAIPATMNFRLVVADTVSSLNNLSFENGEVEDYQLTNITPVPVELISFTGEWQNNDAVLDWATATELNNSHFDIERSFDGVNFMYIGTVTSQAVGGNSNQVINYSYTDAGIKPKTNKNVYYRLIQTDYNGTTEVLGPVVLDAIRATKPSISIFPVPAKDYVTVQTKALVEGDIYTLSIIDNLGKTVQQTTFEAGENHNNSILNISSLPKGVYWIQVDGGYGALETQKFVKIQ